MSIIILGEEYWFGHPDNPKYPPSTVLLDRLIKNKDPRFNYIIIKNPGELVSTINKTSDIKGIFLFQDVISDCYLNNMNIAGMKKYLYSLVDKGIYIYPPINIIDTFGSKRYNQMLNDMFAYAGLPKTRVIEIKNYYPNREEEVVKTLWKNTQEMYNDFDKVVIKKGYSYEAKQVKTISKNTVKSYEEFKERAKGLNYKKFWNRGSNAITLDKGANRYYIMQGFNKIITKGQNEYRFFFHNGKLKYFTDSAGDFSKFNICKEDIKKYPLVYAMKKFAYKIFKDIMRTIWPLKRKPILFRVDVSFAIDDIFQDKYSINVEGFEKPIRIYANELEIDPTNYFFRLTKCEGNDKITTETLQRNFAKYINRFIKKML
jgi:hypothetical protein